MKQSYLKQSFLTILITLCSVLAMAAPKNGAIHSWSQLSQYCALNNDPQADDSYAYQNNNSEWTISCTDDVYKWEERELVGNEPDIVLITRPQERRISWSGVSSKAHLKLSTGSKYVTNETFVCKSYHKVKLSYSANYTLTCADIGRFSGFQNFCLSKVSASTKNQVQRLNEGGTYQWTDLDVAPKYACGLMTPKQMMDQYKTTNLSQHN